MPDKVPKTFVQDIFKQITTYHTLEEFFVDALMNCHVNSVLWPKERQDFVKLLPKFISSETFTKSIVIAALECIKTVTSNLSTMSENGDQGDNFWFKRPILDILDNLKDQDYIKDWSHTLTLKECKKEMVIATNIHSGLHGNPTHANMDDVAAFSPKAIGEVYKTRSKRTWGLLHGLMDARDRQAKEKVIREGHKRANKMRRKEGKDPVTLRPLAQSDVDTGSSSSSSESEDAYSSADDLDDGKLELVPSESSLGRKRRRLQDPIVKYEDSKELKTITALSIAAQSTNARANGFQSAMGTLLRANHAPENLLEVLSHMGISISAKSIDRAIDSLGKDAMRKIRELCRTNLVQYCYDNINLAVKRPEATLARDSTWHNMTTATFFKVHASLEDLRFTEKMWKASPLNEDQENSDSYVKATYHNLLETPSPYEQSPHEAIRDDLISQILRILIESKEEFRGYSEELSQFRKPFWKVALRKADPLPARAMDEDEGTLNGNMSVLDELRTQGDFKPDQASYVTMVHGDLLTCNLIKKGIYLRRNEDTSTATKYTYVVPIPGLFHTLMATGDAFMRTHIPNQSLNKFRESFFSLAAIARPRQALRLKNSPPFRLTHHVISLVTTASILDCWERVVPVQPSKAWAKKKPTFGDLVKVAEKILDGLVAVDVEETVDPVLHNQRLLHRDGLIYLALHQAIKSGDTGRIENLLFVIIPMFQANHKHNYSRLMLELLVDMRSNWPRSFANVVRNHWVENMTGKDNEWSGLDMIQENQNRELRELAGKSSNRTLVNMQRHSPLNRFLKKTRREFSLNFNTRKLTTKHKSASSATLVQYIQSEISKMRLNQELKDREDIPRVIDSISVGVELLQKVPKKEVRPATGLRDGAKILVHDERGRWVAHE